MADIKVNYQTGDIALPQQGGGYRIYKKGEYRFNREQNMFAIPTDDGGWNFQDAPADAVKRGAFLPMSEMPTGDLEFDIEAGLPGALIRGFKGPGDAATGNLPPEEMESRAAETAMLMTGGPGLIRGARGTIQPRPDVRGTVKPPTAAALKEAADAGYTAARGQGVDFAPEAVKSWANDTIRQFEGEGFNQVNNPATWKILNEFLAPPVEAGADTVVNFNGMVAARKALQDAAGNFNNPAEQRWASMAINAIDDFLENPPAAAVASESGVPGAARAGKLYEEANANYAAAKRSQALAGKEQRALDRAGATNSGQNLDNQLRQRIDEIIARPKERRGYTPEEIDFMRAVVRGSFGSNAARYVGNLLGGGGGLGAFVTGTGTGIATGQPGLGMALGAVAPTLGWLGKKGSAALTKRQIAMIDTLTRKRSPLYRKMEAEAPMAPSGDARREALVKALISYDSSQPWLQQAPQESTPRKIY